MCVYIYIYIYIVYTEKVRYLSVHLVRNGTQWIRDYSYSGREGGRERGMGTPLVVIGMSLRFGDVM